MDNNKIQQYKKSIKKYKRKLGELVEKQENQNNKKDQEVNKETEKDIEVLELEIQAIQKQVPIKVKRDGIYSPSICPTCGEGSLSIDEGDGYYTHRIEIKRCPECGQLLEW